MSRELVLLVEQIGREKGIEPETLIDAISAAIVSASRRQLGQVENIKADIDMETGEISLSLIKEVVEEVEEPEYQLTQEDAKEFDPEAAVGDQITIPVEVDVGGLGRIAAQTAKQVIVQRVREAEREMIYNEYKDREGDLIMGIVQRYEKGNYIIDLGKAEALLPYREQSFREQLHRGDRLRAYVLEVRSTSRGPQIILSRTHPGLLIRLFELEVFLFRCKNETPSRPLFSPIHWFNAYPENLPNLTLACQERGGALGPVSVGNRLFKQLINLWRINT